MITLALHHDEAVFVYLSETDTKTIKQLGFISPGFQFDRNFLSRPDAAEQFSEMLGEILRQLKVQSEKIFISIPATLLHLSRYTDVSEAELQPLIDHDLWLNKLKFGEDFIEHNDCQIKLLRKKGSSVFLNAIYFPKALYNIFSKAFEKHKCTLTGIGINLFNISEIVRHVSNTEDQGIFFVEEEYCEFLHLKNDLPKAYARFSFEAGQLFFSERQGDIPEGLCELIGKPGAAAQWEHPLYAASSVSALKHLEDIQKRISNLQVVNPFTVNTGHYEAKAEFDKKYESVFAAALGALL